MPDASRAAANVFQKLASNITCRMARFSPRLMRQFSPAFSPGRERQSASGVDDAPKNRPWLGMTKAAKGVCRQNS